MAPANKRRHNVVQHNRKQKKVKKQRENQLKRMEDQEALRRNEK